MWSSAKLETAGDSWRLKGLDSRSVSSCLQRLVSAAKSDVLIQRTMQNHPYSEYYWPFYDPDDNYYGSNSYTGGDGMNYLIDNWSTNLPATVCMFPTQSVE